MRELVGKYRGRVEDNVDPRRLGRLQVSSPTALGEGVRRGRRHLYSTPSGHLVITNGQTSEVSLVHSSGSAVKLDAVGNIEITSSAVIRVSASAVRLSAGMITLETAMVEASGVVKCDTLVANSVVAASSTPGAVNLE